MIDYRAKWYAVEAVRSDLNDSVPYCAQSRCLEIHENYHAIFILERMVLDESLHVKDAPSAPCKQWRGNENSLTIAHVAGGRNRAALAIATEPFTPAGEGLHG